MLGKLFGKKKKKKSSKPRKLQVVGAQPKPRHASAKVSPRAHAAPQRNAVYSKKSSRRAPQDGFIRRKLKSRGLWIFLLRLGMAGVIVGGLAVMYFARTLPDIRELNTIKKQQGITITSEDGRVVANYGDVYGEYIPYEKVPKALIQAVIATEDRRFFAHGGIDLWGIGRAAVTNMAHGRVVQGGSTVTQQVAKNVFLTPERSLARKVQEVLLAFWLEGRFSKQDIMAIYLNRVYLGSGAYGIDAASKRYFNKPATEMNLAECAMIAGLLKAPSRYSPVANPERAEQRIHQVLLNMVDAGFLKENQVKPALAAFHNSPANENDGGDARYYTDWIVDEIPNYVGNVEEDLVVSSTFDPKLQGYAMDALQNAISTNGEKQHVSQGALVAMGPDGAVKAIVGGLGYNKSQYNRAVQAKRQAGSIFKLFVYLAALEAGMTPDSTVLDAPVVMQVGNKTWMPGNFDKKSEYKGEIPMVQALRESLNTVSVRLAQFAGVGRVAEVARRLGLTDVPAVPSIALGTPDVTLLDMTAAYSHLNNGGNKVVPYGILTIKTRDGKELYKREQVVPQSVLAEGTVEMMNYMLLDVVRRGTGTKAALPGRAVAGKTGTSSNFKDAWFVGFTPQLTAGVWLGNDNNAPMRKITGGTGAAPIWHDFMIHAMDGVEARGIPNSPSNGSGLLPWLFGGSSQNMDQVPQATQPVDEAAPFGAPGQPQRLPFRDPSEPMSAPQAPAQYAPPPAPAPAGKKNDGDVLTPAFWNKLMKDNAPDLSHLPKLPEGKVEYTYPGHEQPRHR